MSDSTIHKTIHTNPICSELQRILRLQTQNTGHKTTHSYPIHTVYWNTPSFALSQREYIETHWVLQHYKKEYIWIHQIAQQHTTQTSTCVLCSVKHYLNLIHLSKKVKEFNSKSGESLCQMFSLFVLIAMKSASVCWLLGTQVNKVVYPPGQLWEFWKDAQIRTQAFWSCL